MNYWISQIDTTTQAFVAHFGKLSGAELNWKPNPSTWSIAQNIDHLIVINQSYFPVLDTMKAGNYRPPFLGRIGFLVRFFGNMILQASQPDRQRKIKTFSIWEPSQSEVAADILERFQQHQEELKRQITSCAKLLAEGAVLASPANSTIVYKLEAAFDIITAHEKRHLAQAQEVLQQMKTSS